MGIDKRFEIFHIINCIDEVLKEDCDKKNEQVSKIQNCRIDLANIKYYLQNEDTEREG